MVNFLMAYVGSAVARSREAGMSPLEWTVYRPRRIRVTAENQPADAKSIDDATMRQHYSRKAHRERTDSGMTDAQPSIDEADWNDTDAPAERTVSPGPRARRSRLLCAAIHRHLPRRRMVERANGRTAGLLYLRLEADGRPIERRGVSRSVSTYGRRVQRRERRWGGREAEEGRKGIGAKLVSRTKAQFRQIPALPISTPKFDGIRGAFSVSS